MRAIPSAAIQQAIDQHGNAPYDLIVVDSARGLLTVDGGDENSSDHVRMILQRFDAIIKESPDTAIVIIHHNRRSDHDARGTEKMRGSGDWLNGVDAALTFSRVSGDGRLEYKGRAGCPVKPRTFRFENGRYRLAAAAPQPTDPEAVAERRRFIRERLRADPDESANTMFKAAKEAGIAGRKADFLTLVKEAKEAGTGSDGRLRRAEPVHASSGRAIDGDLMTRWDKGGIIVRDVPTGEIIASIAPDVVEGLIADMRFVPLPHGES